MCPQLISGPMPHLSCALLKWTMLIPRSLLSVEKHSAALSMITWGVMDGSLKKVLAVSAALALSRSSHLSDNKGKVASQVMKSSIASSVLIFGCALSRLVVRWVGPAASFLFRAARR
jgi:hypothetical protein